MEGNYPFFSIVVPTYRRPQQLARCLQAMSRLDYPRDRFEVIVVDDGGGILLDDIVDGFKEAIAVCLLRRPHEGVGGARNVGVAQAQGDFLALTADDCLPSDDWLCALRARVSAEPHCAIGGKIINAIPGNSFSTASHLLIMYLYGYYNPRAEAARFFTPNNLTLPAGPFRAMGGFDPSFSNGAGEDRDFCERWLNAGYEMTYAPEVVVAHNHPLTFSAFCRQQFGYGRGTFRHRRLQAVRAKGRISFEPLRFYFELLGYPLRVLHEKKNRLAVLLGVSQVANALGFLWESRR